MFQRGIFFALTIVCTIPANAQELTDKQRHLAGRYAQLEHVLLRLVETSGNSNPRQTARLKTALSESKDKLLIQRFQALVQALERRQFSEAVSGQTEIEHDLIRLLQLLESVDRETNRQQEKEALQEFLKDLEEILHNERFLRHQTQQHDSQNLPMLGQFQRDVRMESQALQERISEQSSDGRPQSADGVLPPSQQAMQRAIEQMRASEQQLQQSEREGAVESQEEAIAQLQRVKEELEKNLRQIREEELMQTLEKLEARFKRILQQEQGIRIQTERLIDEFSASPSLREDRQVKIRGDRLGVEQQSVIEESEAALILLREDGTAQAMVESLLQARFDMSDVKHRLEQTMFDSITLHIVDSVIETLHEMLAAVQLAIAEAKERQEQAEHQPSPGEGGAMSEEPLIQLLSELRMIRSMQRRVNDRTARYDSEIRQAQQHPGADLSSLQQAVEELARQQNRISRILHEIRIGKIR